MKDRGRIICNRRADRGCISCFSVYTVSTTISAIRFIISNHTRTSCRQCSKCNENHQFRAQARRVLPYKIPAAHATLAPATALLPHHYISAPNTRDWREMLVHGEVVGARLRTSLDIRDKHFSVAGDWLRVFQSYKMRPPWAHWLEQPSTLGNADDHR